MCESRVSDPPPVDEDFDLLSWTRWEECPAADVEDRPLDLSPRPWNVDLPHRLDGLGFGGEKGVAGMGALAPHSQARAQAPTQPVQAVAKGAHTRAGASDLS